MRLRTTVSRWSSELSVRSFSASASVLGRPRTLEELPRKVEVEVAAMGRFANLVPPRRGRDICQRVGSTYGGTHSLKWVSAPRSVLLVTKRNDSRALAATKKVVEYLQESRADISIVVEQEIFAQLGKLSATVIPLPPNQVKLLPAHIDFVIALGGDGTLLRVSSLFDAGAVPPVLGVSMGSLGFLMPIHIESFPSALEDLLKSRASLLLRMRLQCDVSDETGQPIVLDNGNTTAVHAMNEVTLHRGASQHLTIIDTYVDNQHFTESVADGLLLATPTGSTAYSLSAGGPIVHPSVQSLLLTPIAPRSLSFRTVLLPSDVCVNMRISPRSRGNASLALDGHEVRTLLPAQLLAISMSPFPVPCVSQAISRLPVMEDDSTRSRVDDPWVRDIRRMLRFNAPFQEGRVEGDA